MPKDSGKTAEVSAVEQKAAESADLDPIAKILRAACQGDEAAMLVLKIRGNTLEAKSQILDTELEIARLQLITKMQVGGHK